jgi:hypothetical protein
MGLEMVKELTIRVENKPLIQKAFRNITIPREIRNRRAERCRIRHTPEKTNWLRAAREEPYLDSCVGPLHNVVATGVGIESVAVG